MMKLEWCEVSLICSPIKYTVCTEEGQFQRELKRLDVDEVVSFLATTHSNATTHFIPETEARSPCAIVCIHPRPEKDQIVIAGLIAHEAVHIWQEIRQHIGEANPSSEFEAYSVQWIFQQLMWEYRRQVYGS